MDSGRGVCRLDSIRLTRKVLPSPGVLSTERSPPMISVNSRVMVSPSPVPVRLCPGVRIRSKGRNMRSMFSSAIPSPVSFIVNSATWLRYFRVNEMLPLSVYLSALDSRLMSICRRRFSSVVTSSGKRVGPW